MEPTAIASAPAPAAATATSALPAKSSSQPALPRGTVLAAIIVAAVLPVILLGALITLVVAANYNVLNWME